jgi:hypothetical protein
VRITIEAATPATRWPAAVAGWSKAAKQEVRAGECRIVGGTGGAPDTVLGGDSPRQARSRLLSPSSWRALAGMLRMTLIRLRTGAAYSAPLGKVSKIRCRPR